MRPRVRCQVQRGATWYIQSNSSVYMGSCVATRTVARGVCKVYRLLTFTKGGLESVLVVDFCLGGVCKVYCIHL